MNNMALRNFMPLVKAILRGKLSNKWNGSKNCVSRKLFYIVNNMFTKFSQITYYRTYRRAIV